MSDHSDFLSDVLDELENRELPLLVWGITTGALSRDEVVAIVDKCLARPDAPAESANDIMRELITRALLFELPATSPRRYRTRLAETVRLAANLRQLFPPTAAAASGTARWWQHRPPLVADYRLHVAPRRYPSRDVPIGDALDELSKVGGWTARHTAVAKALLLYPELARFQIDATERILSNLHGAPGRAVIIGAGTGSGKTLAFYLPAFIAMAVRPARQTGVHTLALYPRNELLKDQLREAVGIAEQVNTLREADGARPLRIGALYGETPRTSRDFGNDRDGSWASSGRGWICPYMTCPRCRGDLIWHENDRARGTERLVCGCGHVVENLVLTRDKLTRNPPELLFASTEMLNRNSTNRTLGPLMGWGGRTAPSLVLLDEAHTYTGVHGAQVALLLRRWRASTQRRPVFVGLSATLRDAPEFFADLTGTDRAEVDYLTPKPEEMEEEGREYAVALRVDPVSRVSALSTTIQTAMLFGRVLDTRGNEFLHGSRGFLFTDDLDVTNRLFHDLNHAEGGQRRRNGPTPAPLATLRSRDNDRHAERFDDGQSWDLVQDIGHELDAGGRAAGLQISLTSSQSSGVDQNADLVVATASLEVGVDDARVGLVVQHKAPRDAAAFIQRRGRAGRRRGTRPWTVVVLSDYGRDRFTYQSYDTLFAPEIPARRLPIANRFVLKIQATHALLDWLADRTGIDVHPVLRAPTGDLRRETIDDGKVVATELNRLLTDPKARYELRAHLSTALDIPMSEADALMWDSPRSLLLGVVPTALRRLERRWASYEIDPGVQPGKLLPDFVTQTLFLGLNVPEVWLTADIMNEPDSRPIENALREAVPGKVSRRYGHQRAHDRTWIPLPAAAAQNAVELTSFVQQFDDEGIWTPLGGEPVRVLRPHLIRLESPPDPVTDQSQAFPRWWSQFLAPEQLYEATVPSPSAWHDRVISVGFATSAAGDPIEVRRMTTGARCNTVYRNQNGTVNSVVNYTHRGAPAALGFSLTVDAVRFVLAPLDIELGSVREHMRSPQWRGLAFAEALRVDPALDGYANVFQRRWLALVYTTAYALHFVGLPNSTGPDIHAALSGGGWADKIEEVLNAIYRGDTTTTSPSSLVDDLRGLSQHPAVADSLDRNGRLLWRTDVAEVTEELAQRGYRDTIAAAILAAVQRSCPDAQDRDLLIDVLGPDNPGGPSTVWLTETSMGGLGIVTQFVQQYAADPRRFWGLVEAALGPSEHEYIGDSLKRLLDHVVQEPDSAAANAIARLRRPDSASAADKALEDLRRAWTSLDSAPRRNVVAALSARVLRPGSDVSTDHAASSLIEAWQRLERDLGFEVEAGIFAYLVADGGLAVPGLDRNRYGTDQVYSLLVPRGGEARSQQLQHYQPYAEPPLLDRLLAEAAHNEQLTAIDVTEDGWRDAYVREVCARGAVMLIAPSDRLCELTAAMRVVPTIAVDRDFLRVYGHVRGIRRASGIVQAVVEIRELAQ
ncbi:protein DpdJ [Nocardia wallacei]|uniref:protein DpdJ n=1 Tax=Nocardia wallacei TaxID=480035 RepID=UPI002453FCF0|nr:protein DpdJ [Nocardia wallacei]